MDGGMRKLGKAARAAISEITADSQRKAQFYQEMVAHEQLQRVVAQRGLVVYVRALEQFDGWLQERPALRAQLQPVLQELGLWKIKLGYDPDRDPALASVPNDH